MATDYSISPGSGESHLSAPSPHRRSSRLARSWQLPLLIASVGLFGYSTYRFIDPKPGLTIDERLAGVARLIETDRAEPATEALRILIADESKEITSAQRGQMYLLLARAIEQVQKARGLDISVNHLRIIENTRTAEKLAAKLDWYALKRLGDSYEAIGKQDLALQSYRRAVAANPAETTTLRRKVIEMLIARGDSNGAEEQLKSFLAEPKLSRADRSWALGERSRILADKGLFAEAKTLLDQSIKSEPDPELLGQLHYRLGYCQHKLGDDAEAERLLRLARSRLKSSPEDAEAALLLGQILAHRGLHPEAISFFDSVLVNHPDSTAAIQAKIDRGISRIETSQDDAGLSDLHDIGTQIIEKPSKSMYRLPTVSAVKQASTLLITRGNLTGALEMLTLEQTLEPTPTAEFFGRLSNVYDRRSADLSKAAAALPDGPKKLERLQQARDLLAKAADAAVAQSRGLTVDDDRGYGVALWRGIDLYDRAGVLPQAIAALELFIAERPTDPLTPDAVLRLGKTFHATGQFDKAIDAFQKIRFRFPQSLAASKSGVPMARAYLAKGPSAYPKAESSLRETLDNPLITPEAEEFREALFELAQLYYRTGRFEEAVYRLEEMTARYPTDERAGQLLFLMADSYRKSAALVAVVTSKPTNPTDSAAVAQELANKTERAAARADRLSKARGLFERVIEQFRANPPRSDLEQNYLKLATFYRADCAYDLGQYDEAIRLYDAAAMKYQDDPSSLSAYVQIINAHTAMNRPDEARVANERLRWTLQKMPPEAFHQAQQLMPQSAWSDWVKWTKTVKDGTARSTE